MSSERASGRGRFTGRRALRGGGRWPSQAGALGRPVFSSAGRCVRTSQRQEDSASFLERVELCEVASSLRRGPPCRGCARSPGEGRRPVAPRRRGSRREAAWLLGRKAVPPPEAGAARVPVPAGTAGRTAGRGADPLTAASVVPVTRVWLCQGGRRLGASVVSSEKLG